MNLFLLQRKGQTLMAEFILYITLHGQRSGRTHELRGECVFAFLNANQNYKWVCCVVLVSKLLIIVFQ